MTYVFIGIFLVAFALGGPLIGAICGAGGIFFIIYLNFKLGPKLTLIAIPVFICFLIYTAFEDFVLMYCKHVLLLVFVVLIAAIAICHYLYEENYHHIVIAVVAGFTMITMALLANWMYQPKDFSVPNRTVAIEIQNMNETHQVVYTESEEFEKIVEELEKIEMQGTFEELVNAERGKEPYRVTFLNKNGKELKTVYFLSKHYMLKEKRKGYTYYRWTEDSRFPYDFIVSMYENADNE